MTAGLAPCRRRAYAPASASKSQAHNHLAEVLKKDDGIRADRHEICGKDEDVPLLDAVYLLNGVGALRQTGGGTVIP